MSDVGNSQEPRRSQREKKQATHFVSVNSTLLKRKRSDATTDEDAQSNLSDPDSVDGGADVEEDFRAPKAKGPAKGKAKTNGPPAARKPRAKKAATTKSTTKSTVSKSKKLTARTTTRRRRPNGVDAADFDAEQVARDTKISGDNPLFNAIMNPAAALQSTVEDYLESLSRTLDPSLAEFINCILRTCGCNDSVNADEVVDYDGVVDALDNFTEALKNDDSPIYPLTSKLPVFKRFRQSLSEFLERLIASSAELGSLYTSDLMPTLQTWVVAMSSSQLRSFRHTATVIALEVETALCDVAAAVEKEAEIVSRQREGERKRKAAANRGKEGTAREKELEGKAAEVRERRAKLAEFLKEFVDGVFVHRYRDLDPSIRAECVRAMGLWFAKYPAHFLDGAYLRYVGWVLSDAQTPVRLEAVRALALAYEQTAYIGAAALQHFTERFKPRMVEMAVGDTELSVRVAVVQVLQAIDKHGLLEDEQREKLCLLVFDEEARVRKAVSGFVRGVWEESVEERLVGKRPGAQDKQRAQIKALGMLLVKWGHALDKTSGDVDSDEENTLGEGTSSQVKTKTIASLIATGQKGRIALAVEALWDEIEPVREWENLLDILLLDHSAVGEETSSQGQESTTKDTEIDEAWRLEEVEEGVLLEMLVAVLQKAKAEAAHAKKGEDETVSSDITRALIKALPKLFVKHQTDENRMAEVLIIPQLMDLDLYLEMRMMTAYASLWDDISKQFLSHSSLIVLTNAVSTIRHLLDATSLSNTNSAKILELEDELSTSLRDGISGREEIEIASFSEDEVLALAAVCARVAALIGIRDLTAWIEEDEGGKQSSAWDIISALAERGRLGYREEESMVDRALQILTLHIIWKARALTATEGELTVDEARFKEHLREQRESLLEKLLEFAVGTQSNTAEGVRRAAFQNLMNLHILFCPAQSIAPDGSRLPTASLALSLDDEVQYRCAGFIQAEIERYADELEEAGPAREGSSDEDEESDSSRLGDEAQAKAGKKAVANGDQSARQRSIVKRNPLRAELEKEYAFMEVMATFLRAIRAGVIRFQHSAVLLAHYGRLGPAFDLCSKVIVEILREEGMYKDNGPIVVAVICQALRDSFTLSLEGVMHSIEHSIALGKVLASCLIIRGAQLAVVKKLEGQYVVDIHTTSLTWICKRLAAFESAKNKKARNKSISFFKVLLPLLSTVDNRDALTIKAHLDQVIAQYKLEISPTSKPWEPYRAYEKRLSSAMSKDKATRAKAGRAAKKGAKTTEMLTTDDEGHDGDQTGEEGAIQQPPRPKPRPTRRSSRLAQSGTDGEAETTDGEAPHTPVRPQGLSTPKARPRPRAAYGRKSSTSSAMSSLTTSPELVQVELPPEEPSLSLETPIASRKRTRADDEEQEVDAMVEGTPQDEEGNAGSSPNGQPSASQATQATQVDEIQFRRKRIRH
ncbi:uncharacterized protein LAESUDRAFT_702953 [Laetiporus sulphureus 93-53]|uniref:SCD domain-containing protein n=1 Tax=Laetiporus sulphureus 93-53 TaxID=1314785 RepID=A0A165DIM0_9APHY|nr:uncharacterized protein LAESUDRAFT_702953 [Laetiporus sulphureus 93-53]KZT04963.1 hypothetical protein LAESUDRAFT_702953 [Laetiporus sulphureus 93-53]